MLRFVNGLKQLSNIIILLSFTNCYVEKYNGTGQAVLPCRAIQAVLVQGSLTEGEVHPALFLLSHMPIKEVCLFKETS